MATQTPDPQDINRVSRFVAHEQISDLSTCQSFDCIVLCASAIFHCAETVFSALQARPNLTKTLILCGGISHSTPFLYDAVAGNARYRSVAEEVRGLPESRVLYKIFERFFNGADIAKSGVRVLIEDKSTNCGANAIESRKVLESHGTPMPKSMLIVQDPTMSARTYASFLKAFAGLEPTPKFTICPTFVPEMQVRDGKLVYATPNVASEELWDVKRFCGLIMGEIPRLRDDRDGYGPSGKGFIA